jgi:arylsulfatase A-like enzyme/Tfp pilus assembly protein PilF
MVAILAMMVSAFSVVVEAANNLNVILVTIDTLRADHLGCYGDTGAETPNIDRIAAEGTRFTYTYAQVPFTLPSHASLFTSTYPMWNGVRDSAGPPLAAEQVTLAEVFKQNRYATGAFTAAFVVDGFFGLNQGFDTYYDNFPPRDASMTAGEEAGLQRRADEVLAVALEWLKKNSQGPFFTWIHFYDPHHPYDPPEPFRSRHWDRLYDGEIAYVDMAMGKLIRFLEAQGLREKTVLVVTSDHGEALGDHGETYHGYYVYDSTLRVPLIFSLPKTRNHVKEVNLPVSLLDVAPTILQIVGIPRPPQMQGRGLLASILGKLQTPVPIYGESLFANLHFGWGTLQCLHLGRYKLILSKRSELFDLENDPRERYNLFAENRAMASECKRRLDEIVTAFTRKQPQKDPPKLSEEALNKLRALGYIGAPSQVSPTIAEDLPDPKDKIHLYDLYLKGAAQQGRGRLAEAAATYEKILQVDSTPAIVHHQLGSVYFKMRDYPKAIVSFQAALRLNPRADASVIALARTYGETGDLQAAVSAYLKALSLKPNDPAILNNLALIYLKLGSWDKATETLELAVRQNSPPKEAFYHLGICYQRSQQPDKAAALFRKAIEMDRRFAGAHYNLGIVYALQNQGNAAIEEFKLALESRPDFAEARFNLGDIYARQGQLDIAVQEFQKALQIRPDFAEAHFNLGTVYGKQSRWDNAIEEYQKAISIQPNYVKAYQGLAMIYQQKGMEKEAKAAADAATRLKSGTNQNPAPGKE